MLVAYLCKENIGLSTVVGWLVGWLVGLVGWLVGLVWFGLVGWLVGCRHQQSQNTDLVPPTCSS